jgi:short-subunit dehydrogenase
MKTEYVLIIGAKSDIAKEVAREFAYNGYNLYLAGKEIDSLKEFATDIKIRSNVDVKLKELDLINFDTHKQLYNDLEYSPLGVIVAAGYMPIQNDAQNDWIETLNTINVNYTGIVSILNIIANDMERRKRGFIIGISSVAGDRGRKANYIYGSSKAAFSAYLSGLRNRLFASGIQVLTVKPGFVYTKMTQGMNLPSKLTAYPQEIAKDIYNAFEARKDILYTKYFWKYIMFIIKFIPEFVFKKTSI